MGGDEQRSYSSGTSAPTPATRSVRAPGAATRAAPSGARRAVGRALILVLSVAATGLFGLGEVAQASEGRPISPAASTVPGAPTIGAAVASNGGVTLSWKAPASNGGSAIIAYVVTPYVGYSPQPSQTFSATATIRTVSGLTVGTTYRFKVAAQNAEGVGPSSKASEPVRVTKSAAVPSDEVTVASGDSFWSIAVDVVGDRQMSVDGYWRRLVAANGDRLVHPGNPDLIYRGQVLVLPPLGP